MADDYGQAEHHQHKKGSKWERIPGCPGCGGEYGADPATVTEEDRAYWREQEEGEEAFGLCYLCRNGEHSRCLGVPCECECDYAAPVATDEQKVRSFAEFRDSGLLWLVNRVVFHPRGYALAFHFDDEGVVTGWSLLGNGSEP